MSMYLYGKHSVYERLKANPRSVQEIYFDDKNFDYPPLEQLARKNRIPCHYISKTKLLKLKTHTNLQGVVAKIASFRYADFDQLLIAAPAGEITFIFLDRIFDPQNLGAIIRTVACFGKFAVVIPQHKACDVNETVLHVACGGENFVPVASVVNMRNCLLAAKDCGYWVAGTAVNAGKSIYEQELLFPLCLVLGSEGSGLRYGLQKHLDLSLTIPMPAAQLSLNITAACAIFCHEIARQRPS